MATNSQAEKGVSTDDESHDEYDVGEMNLHEIAHTDTPTQVKLEYILDEIKEDDGDESHDVERGDEIIVDDVADSRQPMAVRVVYHSGALKAIDQFKGKYRVSAGDVSDRVDVVDDDSDEIATDGGRMPCPHRMRATMDLARRWEIDRDDARAYLESIGVLVELER